MFRQQVNVFPSLVFQGGFSKVALISCAIFSLNTAYAVELVEEDEPPAPTETTKECAEGSVWDAEASTCITVDEVDGDQAFLYQTARELAWVGRLPDALAVLDRMEESDKRLTYVGFVARKSGDWQRAETAYKAAILRNPDNLLARSYYGQGLVERGMHTEALVQLSEIRARGGRISWPELALRLSIESGTGHY